MKTKPHHEIYQKGLQSLAAVALCANHISVCVKFEHSIHCQTVTQKSYFGEKFKTEIGCNIFPLFRAQKKRQQKR